MEQTTFSGPILASTIKNTTGTTVGTDIKNTGQVLMAQTASVDLSAGAIAASALDIVIPANSQLVDIVFDSITAASGATNISIGQVGGAATAYVNTFAIGTTVGLKRPTTQAGGALAWEDVGTSDVRFNVTNSAATTAGELRVTIMYLQNNNLS